MSRADRRVPPAGAHGGDAVDVARSLGLDPARFLELSASTNPFAPDVASLLARLLSNRPELVTRYPDDGEACGHLAAALGADPSLLVLTNGGAEAIALVASLEDVGDVVEPEFSLYRRHLPRLEAGGPRWRSNPSNPLGRLAPLGVPARVWDEAFYPLASGRWSRCDAGCWRLGSLTKLWACPGLRLGYALAPDPGSAERLRRRQPQWSVNGLALAALPTCSNGPISPGGRRRSGRCAPSSSPRCARSASRSTTPTSTGCSCTEHLAVVLDAFARVGP